MRIPTRIAAAAASPMPTKVPVCNQLPSGQAAYAPTAIADRPTYRFQ